MHTIFLLENIKEKRHSEDLAVDVRTESREKWWEGADWMHLVQDRDQWRALVNTAMSLQAT
jgi:hypothetical protein